LCRRKLALFFQIAPFQTCFGVCQSAPFAPNLQSLINQSTVRSPNPSLPAANN
jgi:hypothetical protein